MSSYFVKDKHLEGVLLQIASKTLYFYIYMGVLGQIGGHSIGGDPFLR